MLTQSQIKCVRHSASFHQFCLVAQIEENRENLAEYRRAYVEDFLMTQNDFLITHTERK